MREIMESVFCIAYLIVVSALGWMIVRKSRGRSQMRLFGIMTLILVCGDAFHLVPRVVALLGSGLEDYTALLGFGTLVTSITMTVFYVLLYHIWRIRYKVIGQGAQLIVVYALALARIVLCCFPANHWFTGTSTAWGIYRNIPFVLLGALVVVLYLRMAQWKNDHAFRHLWLAVLLSFLFYIPVVLWADANPLVGLLMIPKTCAYVWIVWMGFREVGNERSRFS